MEHKQQAAERKRKYRQAKRKEGSKEQLPTRQNETTEKASQCKRRHAESQQKYVQSKQQHINNNFAARQGLDCFDESTVPVHTVGSMTHVCSNCGANIFKGEKSRELLCCLKSSIKLPPVKEPPELLKKLLRDKGKREQYFRENMRVYNSSLAFASMHFSGKEYQFKGRGP